MKHYLLAEWDDEGNYRSADVTDLLTHEKYAGEAPQYYHPSPHQAIAWASGWAALRDSWTSSQPACHLLRAVSDRL